MTSGPQLFRVTPDTKESERIAEVEFAELGFQERRDIQEWVAANPEILGDDLLIISKEFSGFDKISERPDLIAVDSDGKVVVIELKRDDTGADAHWQAIKYASYLSNARRDDIVRMLAEYDKVSLEEAANRILQHLNEDDLTILNNDQRIILASHRFAPQVTSASLWLNQKAPEDNLITCVQLTPFQDGQADSLYVQATTIIPVPGVEDYVIGIGTSQDGGATSSFATSLARTYARNRNDEVTRFLSGVVDQALRTVPNDIRPPRTSRWAGQGWTQGQDFRYYHAWYPKSPSRQLWANWELSYRINLFDVDKTAEFKAEVELAGPAPNLRTWLREKRVPERLSNELKARGIHVNAEIQGERILVTHTLDALDDSSAQLLATTLRTFIETLTPLVDGFEEESNEGDSDQRP